MSLLALLAFALRAYRIDWQSIWVDENFTIFLSSQDIASITRITSGDVHPPLYYYMVHFWILLTGQSEYALRFASLFFSVLLVPLTYRLGARLLGQGVGATAAFLTAIAPFQVYYGQEARMYSLIAFLSLTSMCAFTEVGGFGPAGPEAKRHYKRSVVYWCALVLSSAALLYVHYFGLLVIFLQNAMVVLTRLRRTSFLLKWLLSQVCVAVIFAPWAMVMLRVYATNDEPWRRHIPLLPMMQEIMVNLSIGQSVEDALSLPLAAGFFLAFLVGATALATRKGSRQTLLLLAVYLFSPILVAYLISFDKPIYGGSRYFLFVAPAFYLLISSGINALRARWLPLSLALLALLTVTSGYSLRNNYWIDSFARDDYRGLARLIEDRARPGDGLVVMNGIVFDYYYKGSLPRIMLPQQYPLSEAEVLDEMNRFSRGKARLWLVQAKNNVLDPDNFIKRNMEGPGQKIEAGAIRDLEYAAYSFSSDNPFQVSIGHPIEAVFGNRISLEGYTLSPQNAVSGQSLEVALFLKATQKLDQEYKISLTLRDATGYLWAQEDKEPTGYSMSRWRVGERVQSRYRLTVPPGTPPGEYTLSMTLYSAAGLQPLPALDSRQVPLGTVARLGNLQLQRGTLPLDASSIRPSRPMSLELAPGIRLLGYDLSPDETDQGGTLTLTLYWQALSAPIGDYRVMVRLVSESGKTVQELVERPHHDTYPTSEWREGEMVRDVHQVPVPGNAPPGKSRLSLTVVGSGTTAVQSTELEPVLVREKLRSFEVPVVPRPMRAELANSVLFLGYDLEKESMPPGGKLALTLYWQAGADGTSNLVVFTHLLDGQNRIWAQHDGPPAGGAQPTSSWVTGQTVADKHEMTIPADAPTGEYTLEVGMYDPSTGRRLKLPNGEDRVLLGKIMVQ